MHSSYNDTNTHSYHNKSFSNLINSNTTGDDDHRCQPWSSCWVDLANNNSNHMQVTLKSKQAKSKN